MESLKEDRSGYALPTQRELLLSLILNPIIEEGFFLTGGTPLSVFYLSHRVSNDLDFFTLSKQDLSEIDFWIKTQWPKESVKIKESPNFLSLLIKEIKVDFVIDPLSINEERERFMFENGHYLLVDTIANIASNKLCALVSRIEPKDFIDFYMILKSFPEFKFKELYQKSKLKDAIFDDPPTAAFQLEMGFGFLKENPSIIPPLLKKIDFPDFFNFYENLIKWLYGLLKTKKPK